MVGPVAAWAESGLPTFPLQGYGFDEGVLGLRALNPKPSTLNLKP